ncbi:hypothetical protein NDU88_001454 [Pleurodeles waltl]|uniref:Uncharacterized protein n=1 Tax=Pleurodeles waltl TaxID=8319 RepID=A0AAV7S9Y5_PLEWA|nr:hypothetical protein NDU88_001454 [Pleurodeles waltl]
MMAGRASGAKWMQSDLLRSWSLQASGCAGHVRALVKGQTPQSWGDEKCLQSSSPVDLMADVIKGYL